MRLDQPPELLATRAKNYDPAVGVRVALLVSLAIAVLGTSTATFAAPDSTAYYFHVKSPVPRGKLAHVVIQGPSGLCRITVSKGGTQMRVRTRTGVNPLAPVSTTQVGDNRVAWEWKVPTNTSLGKWQVRVRCGRAPTSRGTMLVTG